MSAALFCGDPMCKRSVPIPPATRWPLFCPACAAALYPKDLKDKLPRDDLKPRAMDLMTEAGGSRVPMDSKQAEMLIGSPKPGAAAGPANLDNILRMVNIDPEAAAAARRRRLAIIVSLVVAVVVLAVYFGFLRH